VFGDVADDQVAPRAADRGVVDVVGAEPLGQTLVQPSQFAAVVEHLAVARRVGAASPDLVTPVGVDDAGGPDELAAPADGGADGVGQRRRFGVAQFDLDIADGDRDGLGFAVGRDVAVTAGEERDQEPGDSPSCVRFWGRGPLQTVGRTTSTGTDGGSWPPHRIQVCTSGTV